MSDGERLNEDARVSRRFEPRDQLSMFLAGSSTQLVHGDIKDLSELGACVRTDSALSDGGLVTINVRNGYSFLFRARARIVWGSDPTRSPEAPECAHGLRFTELTPFTRKLIRRLGGVETRPQVASSDATVEREVWGEVWDADSDPDLEILFRAERSPVEVDRDRLDVLEESPDPPFLPDDPEPVASAEPVIEPPVEPEVDFEIQPDVPDGGMVESGEWRDAYEAPLAPRLSEIHPAPGLSGDVELSGNLGYFDNTDVLQMLEATRATGVLYLEGPHSGEIHLLEGRICRCVGDGLNDEEAAFRLVVASRGRFHFVPCPVPENARRIRTTTQLVLEAQLRRNRDEPS